MSAAGIPFEEWLGIDQHAARLRARDPEVRPLTTRIMLAAIGWSNVIGHAEFALGGLAGVLMTANPKTGEISIPSRQVVAKEIRKAREMRLIGEASDIRCLVAPDWWEKAGGKGGRTCAHHRVRPSRRSVTEASQASPTRRNEASQASPRSLTGVALSVNPPISESVLQPERSAS